MPAKAIKATTTTPPPTKQPKPRQPARPRPPKPTPAAPPPRLLVLPGAQQVMTQLLDKTWQSSGLAAQEQAEQAQQHRAQRAADAHAEPDQLTVDVLQQLDAWMAGDTSVTLPAWLTHAQQTAQQELTAWHVARGLPTPDDDVDPGEPQSPTEAIIRYPRASNAETPERRLVEYLKCRASVVYFLDNYALVANKDTGIVPFRLWRWQAWLLYQWGRHSKNIVLKGRQIGLSELALGYAFWVVRFQFAKKALFLSKTENDAKELLRRATTMLQHLPPWLSPQHPALTPDRCTIGTWNTSQFEVTHLDAQDAPHSSGITSLPASPSTARSLIASLVILDEWAYQENASDIWAGVEPAADGGGTIIGISTAHGVGNTFHRMWDYACDEPTQFAPVFLSWRRHPLRAAQWFANGLQRAIATGEEPKFHQEYPNQAAEAFIQSGFNVFDNTYLALHEQHIKAEVAERAAQGLPAWTRVDGVIIYEPPVAGHRYIIGADVAEGVRDGDFDAATIIDRLTMREVASLHGRWGPETYARYLDQLGHYYGEALLAVERNNHGHAALLALTTGLAHEQWSGERNQPYPNLYHYSNDLVPGARDDRRPGWPTTITTKPLVTDTLKAALASEQYHPRTLDFIREALVFAKAENGVGMSAPVGYHDDYVMATAIAVYLCTQPDPVAQRLDFLTQYRALVQQKADDKRQASLLGGVGGVVTR